MSTTLSYGFKLPQTGDLGSTFFPNLEDDITQLNGHTHNGTNSAKLTSTSITATTGTAAAVNWVATSGGQYRQSITTPSGVDIDDYVVVVKNATAQVFATIERVSDTTFWIYSNDNSQTFTIYYLS